MKKLLVLSLTSIFVLTGCGAGATETLSCTNEIKNNNLTAKTKYNIDYEDKDVKKVRITYDYMRNSINDTDDDGKDDKDGVGTGTDGTTNDTQIDEDGIIDGIVGESLDDIIGGISDVILDISGLKDRHNAIQNTYRDMNGFSIQNTTDTDDNYKVTYVIDFDTISDNDLNTLNLSRDIDTLKKNYVSQGYTCK